MLNEEQRNIVKRIHDIVEKGKPFVYMNTVRCAPTKAYVKDDVLYVEGINQHGKPIVLEREASRLRSFWDNIHIEGEERLYKVESKNRGWYMKKNDNEAVIWSMGSAYAYLVFTDAFCKANNIDTSTFVDIEYNENHEIYLFRGAYDMTKYKFVNKNEGRLGIICGNWANADSRGKYRDGQLKLFKKYKIENKVIKGLPCWKLTPIK